MQQCSDRLYHQTDALPPEHSRKKAFYVREQCSSFKTYTHTIHRKEDEELVTLSDYNSVFFVEGFNKVIAMQYKV